MMDDRKKISLLRIDSSEASRVDDVVAVEDPLTLFVDGTELVTLLYTPPLAEELALGYLLSEGIIAMMDDVRMVSAVKDGVDVRLVSPVKLDTAGRVRVLTSGCGGGITFTHPKGLKQLKKITSVFTVTTAEVAGLVASFRTGSGLFEETGGVHSAAIADRGKILAFAEDIGRHNAVDKVFGICLKQGIGTADKILLSTGRVSSEILVKCVKRGLPVLVSRSAPTSLAVELAARFDITLIGFARGKRMNIYSGEQRVTH